MDLRDFIKNNILVFDGAMGTMLQEKGLKLGENPELLNIKDKKVLREVYEEYIINGAMVLTTNTFGANELKLHGTGFSVEEIIDSAVKLAKEAATKADAYVALDVGPIGQLLEPMGTLKFEEAYEIFKRQIVQGVKSGADLIIIETMTDLYEAKAALLAAKENSDLPVFVSMSFEANGRTFTGCTPESMAVVLSSLGADAVGVNCSLGPEELYPMIEKITKACDIPVLAQPNAGLPEVVDGMAVYNVSAEDFSKVMETYLDLGVSIIGGCCGTTPEFTRKLRELADTRSIVKRHNEKYSCVCTPSNMVKIDEVKVVGERINPTGKKIFQQALRDNNIEYILKQAIDQVEAGADILDVNVGLPDINETETMLKVVKEIQSILNVPLQLDSSDANTLEAALRIYNGKPSVNSVNGEDEKLDTILPLIKKYGASVIGLTLDEKGIPPTAEERFAIAEKIVNRALEYGIKKEDVFIDCLVLTASAQQKEVQETLKAVRMVHEKLGVKTLLGVSNISFGLPCRQLINETFLASALANGLDLPIMNPNSQGMMDVVNSYKVLANMDKGAEKYISLYGNAQVERGTLTSAKKEENAVEKDLKYIVIKGLREEAAAETKRLLSEKTELEIVNGLLIPALDIVGEKYEKGELFLPQLIQAAETVKEAFEVLKVNLAQNNANSISKGKIIMATVKGDIHDIGKNIVKVILENYGYEVIDLGKDVPVETVVKEAIENDIKLVGLSALMTTTLKSMEETIKALHDNNYKGKIFVGGAVLTPEYAMKIGADYYSKDAKESVEVAKEVFA
ncbi:MAG: homocysteine S-methyltransferase family protein [Clostridium sp.]|nr:homocysteine S-methyltransferase family protein [Clostridium sp.]